MGLFSGFSRALSQIGGALTGAVSDIGQVIGRQAQRSVTDVGKAAVALAPLAQFIPGPIGIGAAAISQVGDFFGSQGQPISVAGFAATQQRGSSGPLSRCSQPAPVLPQRSQFGFGGGGSTLGGGGFSAPFAASTFQGFGRTAARSPQAFGGQQRFQQVAAVGASPFGGGGFGRAFSGFSFLG